MENLNKLIEHYKQTIRIDSSNAWDLVIRNNERFP